MRSALLWYLNYWLTAAVLFAAAVVRLNHASSALYFLFFMVYFVANPYHGSLACKKYRTPFLLGLLVVSGLTLAGEIAFQCALADNADYAADAIEVLGWVDFAGDAAKGAEVLIPDIVVLSMSAFLFWYRFELSLRMSKRRRRLIHASERSHSHYFVKLVLSTSLLLAASLAPSFMSLVYLLCVGCYFSAVAMYWVGTTDLSVVLRAGTVYMFLHLVLIYLFYAIDAIGGDGFVPQKTMESLGLMHLKGDTTYLLGEGTYIASACFLVVAYIAQVYLVRRQVRTTPRPLPYLKNTGPAAPVPVPGDALDGSGARPGRMGRLESDASTTVTINPEGEGAAAAAAGAQQEVKMFTSERAAVRFRLTAQRLYQSSSRVTVMLSLFLFCFLTPSIISAVALILGCLTCILNHRILTPLCKLSGFYMLAVCFLRYVMLIPYLLPDDDTRRLVGLTLGDDWPIMFGLFTSGFLPVMMCMGYAYLYAIRPEDVNGSDFRRTVETGDDVSCQVYLESLPAARQIWIHAVDTKGRTLLHVSAKNGTTQIMLKLLEEGVIDANAVDKSGCTALHLAYEKGYLDVVTILKRHTDKTLANANGLLFNEYPSNWKRTLRIKLRSMWAVFFSTALYFAKDVSLWSIVALNSIEVDYIRVGYLFIVLWFVLMPKVCRKAWPFFVFYCGLILFVQFCFLSYWPLIEAESATDNTIRILIGQVGLESEGNPFQALWAYLTIFLMSAFQNRIYQEKERFDVILRLTEKKSSASEAFAKSGMWVVVTGLLCLTSWIVYGAVLGPTLLSLISGSFFVVALWTLCLFRENLSSKLIKIQYINIFYAGVQVLLQYSFQIDAIAALLSFLGDGWLSLEEIGLLQIMGGKLNLLYHMLPSMAMFAFSALFFNFLRNHETLRERRKRESALPLPQGNPKSDDPAASNSPPRKQTPGLAPQVSEFQASLGNIEWFFEQYATIIMMLGVWLEAMFTADVFSLLYITVIVVFLLVGKVESSWFILGFISGVMMLGQYVVAFTRVQEEISSDDAAWFGLYAEDFHGTLWTSHGLVLVSVALCRIWGNRSATKKKEMLEGAHHTAAHKFSLDSDDNNSLTQSLLEQEVMNPTPFVLMKNPSNSKAVDAKRRTDAKSSTVAVEDVDLVEEKKGSAEMAALDAKKKKTSNVGVLGFVYELLVIECTYLGGFLLKFPIQFSLELYVCWVILTCVMRGNITSLVYLTIVGVPYVANRTSKYFTGWSWTFLVALHGIVLIAQYAIYINPPPFSAPWVPDPPIHLSQLVSRFYFLGSYKLSLLSFDFVLYLLAVYRRNHLRAAKAASAGTSNPVDEKIAQVIHYRKHFSSHPAVVERCQALTERTHFWFLVLADRGFVVMVFIAGSTSVDIVSLGYLLASFVLLFEDFSKRAFMLGEQSSAMVRVWEAVHYWAFGVICLILLFQLPYFSAESGTAFSRANNTYYINYASVFGLDKLAVASDDGDIDVFTSANAQYSLLIFVLIELHRFFVASPKYAEVVAHKATVYTNSVTRAKLHVFVLYKSIRRMKRGVVRLRKDMNVTFKGIIEQIKLLNKKNDDFPDDEMWPTPPLLEMQMSDQDMEISEFGASPVHDSDSDIDYTAHADQGELEAKSISEEEQIARKEDANPPKGVILGDSPRGRELVKRVQEAVPGLANWDPEAEPMRYYYNTEVEIMAWLMGRAEFNFILFTTTRIIEVVRNEVTMEWAFDSLFDRNLRYKHKGFFKRDRIASTNKAEDAAWEQLSDEEKKALSEDKDVQKEGKLKLRLHSMSIGDSAVTHFFWKKLQQAVAHLKGDIVAKEEVSESLFAKVFRIMYTGVEYLRDLLAESTDWTIFAPLPEGILSMVLDGKADQFKVHNGDISFVEHVMRFLQSNSASLVFFFIFVKMFESGNFLALVLPVLSVSYGLVVYPRPPREFWIFVASYIMLEIVIKYAFQLDIFCLAQDTSNTFYYSLQPNPQCFALRGALTSAPGTDTNRLTSMPYLFGIHKQPAGSTFFAFVFWDYVVLLVLAWHRHVMIGRGLWYASEKDIIPALFRREHLDVVYTQRGPAKGRASPMPAASPTPSIEATEVTGTVTEVEADAKEADALEYEASNTKSYGPEFEGKRDGLNDNEGAADSENAQEETESNSLVPIPTKQQIKAFGKSVYARAVSLYLETEVSVGGEGKTVYAMLFFVQLMMAFYILFAYSFMATDVSNGSNLGSQLDSNTLQGGMVLTFFTQILFIVMERGCYLYRKKTIKYILTIFQLTWWSIIVFFEWAPSANISFTDNHALRGFWLVVTVYLVVSCWQIKYGYPPAESLSFPYLTKTTSSVRGTLFSIYLAIPFLFELRTLYDWMSTETTLNLFECFKLEDIHTKLYKVKYDIDQRRVVRKRGERVVFMDKLTYGFLFFAGCMCVLFIPLLLFSNANPSTVANNVEALSIKLTVQSNGNKFRSQSLGTFSGLRSTDVVTNDVFTLLNSMSLIFDEPIGTVQSVVLDSYSTEYFELTPPGFAELLKFANSSTASMVLEYTFSRPGPPGMEQISDMSAVDLSLTNRTQLLDFLTNKTDTFVVEGIIPSVVRLPAGSKVIQLSTDLNDLIITRGTDASVPGRQWLFLRQQSNFPPSQQVTGVHIITVSDKFFAGVLGLGVGYSIISIYTIIVFTIGKFVRQAFSDMHQRIMYEDGHNIDHLMIFVHGIYIARYCKQLLQEEELYRRLIYIYRTPSLLRHLTKRKTE